MKQIKKLYDGWIKTEDVPTYHGWPTMIHTQNGELLAVCSGNVNEFQFFMWISKPFEHQGNI